jgi:hypothetical protein
MNFKIAFVGAALMAFGGLFAVGCGGDACTTAADDITAAQSACPDYKAPAATTTGGTAAECTDALGKTATCVAACTTGTSCECMGLDKSKMCAAADSKKFLDCFAACAK